MINNQGMRKKGNSYKVTLLELAKLALFAIAFGYIEGAVAHYLRLHYYPEGFTFQLKDIDRHVLIVEMGREVATMVVLFFVAALTRGSLLRRCSNFVFIFGIWDITYYGALYLFERWPSSILDWDVLFLIPLPWYAPLIVPITISLLGIIGALTTQILHDIYHNVRIRQRTIFFMILALGLWFISFVIDSPGKAFPSHFHWALFIAGNIAVLVGFLDLVRENIRTNK